MKIPKPCDLDSIKRAASIEADRIAEYPKAPCSVSREKLISRHANIQRHLSKTEMAVRILADEYKRVAAHDRWETESETAIRLHALERYHVARETHLELRRRFFDLQRLILTLQQAGISQYSLPKEG